GTQALCDHFLRSYGCVGVFKIARNTTRNCMTCLKINKKVMRKSSPGGRELAKRPFQNIQIDLTELPALQGYKYILVLADHLTRWVEAIPTRNATASIVSKVILEQIILHYGTVNNIDSTAPGRTAGQIPQALGIRWHLQSPWRPQSSGQVERTNQTLKVILTKLVVETKVNWIKCLPLALVQIRIQPRTDLGISPYEAVFGLPYRTTPYSQATYEEGEVSAGEYVIEISKNLERLRRRGYLPQTTPTDFKIHNMEPGDWVLVKIW
ncbi:TF211 protein, partial [Mystacornis crossleyi]|nr:TF211 protein [Mystacornis crossleyi]